jgi:cytochrome c-type biogenesis protein
MNIEAALRGQRRPGGSSREFLAGNWHRALPMVSIAVLLAVSLAGMYALGRSLPTPLGRTTAASGGGDIAELARTLTRVGWSSPDVPVDAILVTPDYFRSVGWLPRADMNPRDHLIFMVSENIHDGDLPAFLPPQLWVDDVPAGQIGRVIPMAESPHHRTMAVVFDRPDAFSGSMKEQSVRLVYPQGNAGAPSVLSWDGALIGSDVGGEAAVGITFNLAGASFLALLGGMLASMWPCLFQLTAYFIPSLAGVSMTEARRGVPTETRWRVVKMATFFVLGFVIVYTLAGAAAGLAAQSFGTKSLIDTWRRPLTMVAGVVMIFMALRVAARSRLPLVCKMPLMNRMADGRPPSYASAMIMGLAYATGCATCFGAALLVGMLVYVGVAGAPLTGAAVMFIFSAGMGIPLIIGAVLMARVLPFLERLGYSARYMSLASAAMMLVMAVLLLSDRFMSFSNLVAGFAG